MLAASLRRSGGSLIMTIPQSYVEQNQLDANSRVVLEINGHELKITPSKKRLSLDELLAQTPAGLCHVDTWDEMPDVGNEA
jgi:antitoxin component of MazEF toxin-antitoxin module